MENGGVNVDSAKDAAKTGEGKLVGDAGAYKDVASSYGMKPDEIAYTIGALGYAKGMEGVKAFEESYEALHNSGHFKGSRGDFMRQAQALGSVATNHGRLNYAVGEDGKLKLTEGKSGNSQTVDNALHLIDGTDVSNSSAAEMALNAKALLYSGAKNDDGRQWQISGAISGGMGVKQHGEKMSSMEAQVWAAAKAKWKSEDQVFGWAFAKGTGFSSELEAGGRGTLKGATHDKEGTDRMQVAIHNIMAESYNEYDRSVGRGYKGSADQFVADNVQRFQSKIYSDAMARKVYGLTDLKDATINEAAKPVGHGTGGGRPVGPSDRPTLDPFNP